MTPFAQRALLAVEKRLPRALLRSEGWLRFATTALQVLLVIAIARALAGLLLALLFGPALPSANPSLAGIAAHPGAAASGAVDDTAISAWHLFGQAETVRPVAAPPPPMPVTPLNLRLVGVFFMGRGNDRALALIADGNNPERGYHMGDSLPGGARLQRIQRDHVVVSRGGREEVLNLPKLGEAIPTAPEFVPQEGSPGPEGAEPSASGTPQVIDASAVAERLRGEVMTRPEALEDIAFASPYLRNGEFAGFRLRQGRDHRLLRQLGLNTGDVITEVNGSRLSSPAQGFTLLQDMLSADQVSVRVLRNGAEVPLTFWLSGQPPR